MNDKNPDGTFAEGHKTRQTHGGESAVKSIQRGESFTGLAAQEERTVTADLETRGRREMVREQCIRLHTASRLYWNAVQSAADAGDLAKLDGYIARFGWLAGASLRAWAQLRGEEPDADKVIDYEQIIASANNENTDN